MHIKSSDIKMRIDDILAMNVWYDSKNAKKTNNEDKSISGYFIGLLWI